MAAKMEKEDWAPGFSIKHFIKDMRIAVEEADQRGAELPVLKQVLKHERLQEQGQGDLGTQAIIKAYRGKNKSAAPVNMSGAALFQIQNGATA